MPRSCHHLESETDKNSGNVRMIDPQYQLILLLCFVAFSLAIPFSPSHHANPSTSTALPLPSTSHIRVPSTTAPPVNLTSTHLSEVLAANHTTPPLPDSSTLDQPQWSPGDIGTIIFGCIASILAVLGLYLTLWLARGGSGSLARYSG